MKYLPKACILTRCIYREYIQNSTDSIDKAVADGIISSSDAAIHIRIDGAKQQVIIHDNGCGILAEKAREVLLSIGDSKKNGVDERGFRGIGRLAGLAYAEEVKFITSSYGEKVKTVMICDCIKMQELLQKSNTETLDVMETFKAISRFADPQPENKNEHYFEVQLMGISLDSGLLEENTVWNYLSETAPVDFNSQQFSQAQKIRDYFSEHGCPITCYKILRGSRKLPIYKPYFAHCLLENNLKQKIRIMSGMWNLCMLKHLTGNLYILDGLHLQTFLVSSLMNQYRVYVFGKEIF